METTQWTAFLAILSSVHEPKLMVVCFFPALRLLRSLPANVYSSTTDISDFTPLRFNSSRYIG